MPVNKDSEYAVNSQCYINEMMKHVKHDLDKLEREIKYSKNRAENMLNYRKMLQKQLDY